MKKGIVAFGLIMACLGSSPVLAKEPVFSDCNQVAPEAGRLLFLIKQGKTRAEIMDLYIKQKRIETSHEFATIAVLYESAKDNYNTWGDILDLPMLTDEMKEQCEDRGLEYPMAYWSEYKQEGEELLSTK